MLFLAVLSVASLTKAEDDACRLLGPLATSPLFQLGDIVIGAIFSIHNSVGGVNPSFTARPDPLICKSLNFRELQFAQTVAFAVDEINTNYDILPGFKVGYKVYDSCGSVSLALMAALDFANGQDIQFSANSSCPTQHFVSAIIGESTSTSSLALASTFATFRIPLISHCATCDCLSNRNEFPSFFRTIPSDSFQTTALVKLMKYFGWSWIGTVRSDNDYGNTGMSAFITKAQKEGICIEYSVSLYRSDSREKLQKIIDIIKTSTSKVVLIFMNTADAMILFKELNSQNVTGIQFVGSEAWVTDPVLISNEEYRFLTGTIGVGIPKKVIPGLEEYLYNINTRKIYTSPLMMEFWEEVFNCTFRKNAGVNEKLCTGLENLRNISHPYTDVSNLRVAYNVYKAVYLAAHAMNNLLPCGKGLEYLYRTDCVKTINIQPWQVANQLKSINFTFKTGEDVYFNENQTANARYDVINWQIKNGKTRIVTIGYYDTSAPNGSTFWINNTRIMWTDGQNNMVPKSVCSDSCTAGTRKAFRKGRPVCCFDCIPCTTGKISNATDAVDCFPCPWKYWPNTGKSQCILKKIDFLSYNEILGTILVVLPVSGAFLTFSVAIIFFHHRRTPIVKANNSELSFLLLFSLTLCFLCSLTFIGEPSDWSCILRHIAFGITFVLCISCILVKTIVVLMAFKASQPGNKIKKWFGPVQQKLSVAASTFVQIVICTLWLTLSPPFLYHNTKLFKDTIILECDVGSPIAFYLVLGYIGLLSGMCFVFAFLARQLPDNFNEAKHITFSMLIFCAVWLTFIPAYISSPGKYIVAVETFAILSSSFGLLLCIFAPKCYIILLNPEKNTRKHLMGKNVSKSL
ncbi:extracellular calcium-sensing receptor-like [Erpetoichthys calabaricus]|uniref:extracellular calcium-sensing receptor-like n=1 Tax=Erpetoichthys calabaricus TaxID=27687 RepID=UPI002234C711|nr:extracellular calcium-sensing receptor-like [Erpetoichthys calabaricus]